MYSLVQVNCAPCGADEYPLPKTIYILRSFASEKEAREYWPHDLVHNPPTECPGQNVYQVLWDTQGPLNLDRACSNDNKVSNAGMWLPPECKQAIESGQSKHVPIMKKSVKSSAYTTVASGAGPARRTGMPTGRPGPYRPPNPHRPL